MSHRRGNVRAGSVTCRHTLATRSLERCLRRAWGKASLVTSWHWRHSSALRRRTHRTWYSKSTPELLADIAAATCLQGEVRRLPASERCLGSAGPATTAHYAVKVDMVLLSEIAQP